jgi:hypothetical protein
LDINTLTESILFCAQALKVQRTGNAVFFCAQEIKVQRTGSAVLQTLIEIYAINFQSL